MVETATPKGTKQSHRGNEEKRNLGQGVGRTPSRSDERRNPHIRVGRTVIGLRCSEYTNWIRA